MTARCLTVRLQSLLCAAAGAVLLAAALPAAAQFEKPSDAIEYRQGTFFAMGQHLGRIGAMANNKAPFDAKAAAENAETLAFLSKLPFAGFGPGTDKGQNTKAKPEIWKEKAKFDDLEKKMQDSVAKLNTAAKSGEEAQVKAAFGDAAKSCKACHDNYRNK